MTEEVTKTDRLLQEIEKFRKYNDEAHRIGRGILYEIETNFQDLHLFEYYKEITYELAQRSCFTFQSKTIRCGTCLSCKAVLIVIPSTFTPNEIKEQFHAPSTDSQNPGGNQENDSCKQSGAESSTGA